MQDHNLFIEYIFYFLFTVQLQKWRKTIRYKKK